MNEKRCIVKLNFKWLRLLALWMSFLLLAACGRDTIVTPQTTTPTVHPTERAIVVTETSQVPETPTLRPTMTQTPTLRPTMTQTPTLLPTMTETSFATTQTDCLKKAISRERPQQTSELMIYINVPVRHYEKTIDFFNEMARDCDGLYFLGRQAEGQNWPEMLTNVSKGEVWWILPSLEHATETIAQWSDSVDYFAYAPELNERTPENEKQNLEQSLQMAVQLAIENDLAYVIGPSYQMSRRHSAELAQHADIYTTQNFGLLKRDPERVIPFIDNISKEIRAVNPDILLFPTLSTHLEEADPHVMYDLTTKLLGKIDGVAIMTSGSPESTEKLKILVGLLRGKDETSNE